jgi:SAM-dependent methyltransferase
MALNICPACGASTVEDDVLYNDYLLNRCRRCTFVFTEQRQFPTDLYDKVYSNISAYGMKFDAARQTYEGNKGYADLSWVKKKALRWLNARIPSGCLLDLGSGPGTFLMVARRRYGYDVQGIELASEAAKIANGFRITTFCGTADEFAQKHSGEFDAVTSFEVLEHVSDPLLFLESARSLLTKNGALILSVPNVDDPYCLRQTIPAAMPPIHINFFNRGSLTALLRRAGFTINRAFTLPIPSSSVRNLYGKNGFILRIPYLLLARLAQKADGTTLLVMATPATSV